MESPVVCDAQMRAHDRNGTAAICHAKPAVLAIRLTRRASFPEKLRQLIVKMRKEKAPASGRFCISNRPRLRQILTKLLALRELEGTAGLGAAVLLALDHAAVAGEETALLQHAAQLRLEIGESLGDAVADRTGLARKAAAGHGADHVILAGAGGGDQRLLDHHSQHGPREVNLDFTGID